MIGLPRNTSHRVHRGFTTREALGITVTLLVLIGTIMPLMGSIRARSRVLISLNNLEEIGAAMSLYAADWNGRQPTYVVDELASFGDTQSEAFDQYGTFGLEGHPALILGWGLTGGGNCVQFAYGPGFSSANQNLLVPLVFDDTNNSIPYFGSFRFPNGHALRRGYLGNKFHAPVFYAPDDGLAYGTVHPAFDIDVEYVDNLIEDSEAMNEYGDIPAWSSYCMSPAAMFGPEVMRHPDDGGWQDPWLLDDGLRSPALDQALYPDLKTLVLEHNWNQAPPLRCNPAFFPATIGECEPYFFNHGGGSMPATLFYDLSVRLLPNKEVSKADLQVLGQTGSGLWSRDTPFGVDGYFNELGFDSIELSHHILTTDGIRGRDTTR